MPGARLNDYGSDLAASDGCSAAAPFAFGAERPPGVLASLARRRLTPGQYRLRVAELEAIGITTAGQAASLRFYGLLGVEAPDPGEDHVEARTSAGSAQRKASTIL